MVNSLRLTSTGISLASQRHSEHFNYSHSLRFWIGEEVFAMLPMVVAEPSWDQRLDHRSNQVFTTVSIRACCFLIGGNNFSTPIDH